VLRNVIKTNYQNIIFLHIFLFLLFSFVGATYSALIIVSRSQLFDSIFTIFFIFFCIIGVYYIFKKKSYYCWALASGIHFGIFLGILLTSPSESTIWVTDSQVTHGPYASLYSEFFLTGQLPASSAPQGKATHVWIGFFFFLFGKSIYSSIIGQYILKIFTCFFIFLIGKNLLNKRLGELSATIYALAPTPLFYTTVLYKEFMIHFLYTVIIYFLYKSILSKKIFFAFSNIFLIIPFFYLLMLERFYFIVLLFPSFFIFLFNKNKNTIWAKIILLSFSAYYVVAHYSLSPKFFFVNFELLSTLRLKHSEFLDILYSYNYNIPYFLAVIKIILTPFFSFNKFDIFFDFAQLLIWGSFVHQVIITMAIFSFLSYLIHFKRYVVFFSFGLPFLLFILFAAYVSPWAGRIRDSFYPLISVFAALFFLSIKIRKKTQKIPFKFEFEFKDIKTLS